MSGAVDFVDLDLLAERKSASHVSGSDYLRHRLVTVSPKRAG